MKTGGGFLGRLLCLIWAIGCVLADPSAKAQTLTFVPGPSGTIKDPTIPLGSLPVGVWTTFSADLRGDGRRDLLLGMGIFPPTAVEPGPLHILRPNPAGTALTDVTRQLLGQGALPSTFGAAQIAVGNFNRDGKPDIYVAAGGIDQPPLAGERNVLLVSNADGTYSTLSTTLPSTPGSSTGATVGDINGDGILDIFVNNTPLPARSYFLIGRGDGMFDQNTNLLPPDISIPNGGAFDSALLVDLDNDGYPDLVLGSFGDGAGRNLILFNDGTGNFNNRPRVELPIGFFGPTARTNNILSMDINNDGMADLLLHTTQTGLVQDRGSAIQVLINRGNGVFTDETAAILGASASRTSGILWSFLRTADINGDGRLDFFATGAQLIDNAGNVSLIVPMIWLNNGNGTFAVVNSDIFPNVPTPLEVMDVDGDGRLDFVTTSVDNTTGQFNYRTFLNRTARTVPSEPLIGSAVPGDARAAIFFSPPLGRNTVPITGYTATCRQGTLPATFSASAANSPITVPGLTNGKFYLCSVTAGSDAGRSLPSRDVIVTPSALAPLTLLAVKSRKRHGVAGIFDISIDQEIASNGPVSIEPRSIGTGHSIIFQFNAAINSFASVTAIDEASTMIMAVPAATGNDLVVTLPIVADNKRVSISLPSINGISINASATIGFLVGDASGSRAVTAADISAIKASLNKPLDDYTCKFDVNLGGAINQSDVAAVKARAGLALP